MFGWLKRKHASLEESWLIGKFDDEGMTVFVRMRKSPPSPATLARFPDHISIVWLYDGSSNSGLPDSDTLQKMTEFEERLELLETNAIGLMVVSVTGNNRKEWKWYVTNSQRYMEAVNQTLSGHPRYPVQFELSSDPNWETYYAFFNAIK